MSNFDPFENVKITLIEKVFFIPLYVLCCLFMSFVFWKGQPAFKYWMREKEIRNFQLSVLSSFIICFFLYYFLGFLLMIIYPISIFLITVVYLLRLNMSPR